MIIKGLVDSDFQNYKKISMFILFPCCSFKCNKDSGLNCCQNELLFNSPNIEISIVEIVKRYHDNLLTQAIVCGGMEPFDSPDALFELITKFRSINCSDDIVIFSGYNKEEILPLINSFKVFEGKGKIIVKFGRYIPNSNKKYDDILGVTLASENQYAEVIVE